MINTQTSTVTISFICCELKFKFGGQQVNAVRVAA